MSFKAKRTSLIVLIVLLVVSLFGAVCFGLTGKTNTADAYVKTIRYGSNGVYDYNINHWKNGQGQRVSGQPENGGTWWFGYGDINTTSSSWTQTATFNSGNIGFYDPASGGSGAQHAHNYFWGFNAATRSYASASTQTMFKYLAEADGFVKLSGIISKHVYNGVHQFGLNNEGTDAVWLNFDWGAQASSWTWNDGASFTIGIWRVTSAGKVACVDEQTFTSAFRYDVNPNGNSIAVETGDILYVTIKCNNPGTGKGDWDNTCLTLLSSEFTEYTAPSTAYADTAVAGSTYYSHMTGQKVRNEGETSGYWRYGYGDATNGGTYTFTEMTYGASGTDTYRYTSSTSHNIFWAYQVKTGLYSTSNTQTFYEWTAEADGAVSFTGLVKKADSNTRVLTSYQNNTAKISTSVQFDQNQFGWTNGDSYTLTMYQVTKAGAVSVLFEQTFTKEFALLIPTVSIHVATGDRIVFGYKCNALVGTDTSAVIAIKAKVTDAAPALAQTYLNKMVLQANANTKINGFGIADKTVEVTVKDSSSNTIQTKTGVVASSGDWTVTLDPMASSFDSKTVEIKYTDGTIVKTLTDVRTGQVWLCSGQSNMAYTLAALITDRKTGADPWHMTNDEVKAAGLGEYIDNYSTDVYSKVRLYQVGYNSKPNGVDKTGTPYQYTSTQWAESETLQQWMGYSAYALGFAFRLQQASGEPVGVIVSAVGGSSIEEWLSSSTITNEGLSGEIYHSQTSKPQSHLYNGMMYPIRNSTVSGLVWYQGCADRGWNDDDTATAAQGSVKVWTTSYSKKMVAFAKQVRSEFGENLPIIVQQLAQDKASSNIKRMWQTQWDLQNKVSNLYVSTGVGAGLPYSYALGGDPTDYANTIHPMDKYGISKNAANIAMRYVYGDLTSPGVAAYPSAIYKSGSNVIIDYGASESDAGYKLVLKNYSTVTNLEAYNGSAWVKVSGATIDGTRVIIPNGSSYTKVRYACYNVMCYGSTNATSGGPMYDGGNTTYTKNNSEDQISLYTENGVPAAPFNEIAIGSGSSGVNMTLGEDLSFSYKFILKTGYTNPVVHYSFNGRNVETTATQNSDGSYTARFTGIAPQDLNDTLTVSKVVAKDALGNSVNLRLYWAKESYVPMNYLTELKASDSSVKTQKIVVNLLNYGAAAQTYLGHDTTNLANAGLSSADQTNYAIAYDANAVSASAVRSLTGTAVNSVKFDSARIYYSNKLGFGIIFKVANGTSGAVALNVTNGSVNVDITDFVQSWDDGAYTYYVAIYEGVNPNALATEFNFTVKIDGVAVGQVLNYNVYANMAMLAGANDNNAKLLKALYSYSEAVKAYNA
ncbi:MAG: hypothetical protein IJY57_04895 [Clostridia bacterium]|nr:hypothetical protein [Clostridia bacterium]